MIWGPLEPYILYVKIAAAALVVALVFGAGWTVRGWRCDAAQTDLMRDQAEQRDEAIRDWKATAEAEKKRADAKRGDYYRSKAELEARLSGLEEELKNARLAPTPPPGQELDPDLPFSREFVRLWNDAIHAANGSPADPKAGPGVSGTDTSAARVTREDVLNNVKRIAGIYAGCKLKHDKIIEFEQGETK